MPIENKEIEAVGEHLLCGMVPETTVEYSILTGDTSPAGAVTQQAMPVPPPSPLPWPVDRAHQAIASCHGEPVRVDYLRGRRKLGSPSSLHNAPVQTKGEDPRSQAPSGEDASSRRNSPMSSTIYVRRRSPSQSTGDDIEAISTPRSDASDCFLAWDDCCSSDSGYDGDVDPGFPYQPRGDEYYAPLPKVKQVPSSNLQPTWHSVREQLIQLQVTSIMRWIENHGSQAWKPSNGNFPAYVKAGIIVVDGSPDLSAEPGAAGSDEPRRLAFLQELSHLTRLAREAHALLDQLEVASTYWSAHGAQPWPTMG